VNIALALDALKSLWRSSLDTAGMADVLVASGPDPQIETALNSVTIGIALDDNDPGAIVHNREERGAALRSIDSVDVVCSVYAGSGEVDMDTHRRAAGAVLAVLDSALARNRTLGGTASLARIVSSQWLQSMDENGAGVGIALLVNLRFLS
jgi:hypothetical protein